MVFYKEFSFKDNDNVLHTLVQMVIYRSHGQYCMQGNRKQPQAQSMKARKPKVSGVMCLNFVGLALKLAAVTHTSTEQSHNTNAHITTSISVLECPMLQTMQPFFIRSSCSLVTTFLLPILKNTIN